MKQAQPQTQTPTDCLGREIKVGDEITYPGRVGSSMYVRFGKVVDILARRRIKVLSTKRGWSGERLVEPRLTTVFCTDRVTITTFPPEVREALA